MNIEDFEKMAKATLDRFRPETDNEQIWQNVEPHLKKKKRRRFVIWFFWGAGLALLGLYCWKKIDSGDQYASCKTQTPKPREQESAGQATVPAPATLSTISPEAAKPDTSNKNSPPRKPLADPITAGNREKQAGEFGVKNLANMVLAGQPGPRSDQPNEPKKPPETPEQTLPLAPGSLDISSVAANEKTPPEAPVQAHPDQPVKENVEAASPLPIASEKDRQTASARKSKKTGKRTSKNRANPHSISLQAGAFFPLRILKNNPGVQANQTLLDGRKTSEKTLEGISAGVFYSFSGRKGLVLRGGLDYKRINERFEVRYTNKKVEVVQGVLTKTVDASGQTISQTTGDKTVTTTVEYSNTAYNSYQFLNLPIGIGYKRINNKSTWEMVGGMDVNLLFRFDGTIYNEFVQPTEYSYPYSSAVFRKNLGLGLWGTYGYSRNINSNIRWQLSMLVSVPLKPVTTNDYLLKQRFFNFGLQGGLVFDLKSETSKNQKSWKR